MRCYSCGVPRRPPSTIIVPGCQLLRRRWQQQQRRCVSLPLPRCPASPNQCLRHHHLHHNHHHHQHRHHYTHIDVDTQMHRHRPEATATERPPCWPRKRRPLPGRRRCRRRRQRTSSPNQTSPLRPSAVPTGASSRKCRFISGQRCVPFACSRPACPPPLTLHRIVRGLSSVSLCLLGFSSAPR